MPGVTCCVLDEVNSGDLAIGGQPLTTQAPWPPALRLTTVVQRPGKVAIFTTGIPWEPISRAPHAMQERN
jgi:hypothetical protein